MTSTHTQAYDATRGAHSSEHWHLRLYIARQTVNSQTAIANLERICAEHLAGRYSVAVIDVTERPALARGDMIVATPTLVRELPVPMRQIIGDLSDTERVLIGLQILPAPDRSGAGDDY